MSVLRIGIQGVRASFHDVAAREYFGSRGFQTQAVECDSFPLLARKLSSGETDFSLMAIENSIAGSILPNYHLLEQNRFKVIGEIYLRIKMAIMALPGQSLASLQFVQSHPMALMQCEDFLGRHPHIKVLGAADTAESAKIIADKNLAGHAAIAGAQAATAYGLELLADGIETNKQNYTRFLVISRDGAHPGPSNEAANKASLRFEIDHKAGSLLQVLTCFRDHGVNMTKLQSVPILGRPTEYAFHVDVEWKDEGEYRKSMRELDASVNALIHFGEYKKAEYTQ